MTSAERAIVHKGRTLAIYVPATSWGKGLKFYSSDGDFIQAGTWAYQKGTRLGPHAHNEARRESARTQEVVFIRQGRVRAHILDETGAPVEQIDLAAGDTLIVLEGGHGYEVLEDDTLALEVKNGPYPGPDADRRKLLWPDTR